MKAKTLTVIIALVVMAAIGLYIYWSQPSGLTISSDEQLKALNAPVQDGGFILPQVKWLANGKPDLSGPIDYKVSFGSADGPTISKIVFAPYDVKPGDTQNLYAIAADSGGVSSLTASIQTDKGVETVPLKLVQGSATSGVWQGSWTVRDTKAGYYPATFAVASINGATRSTSAVFMDSVFSLLFGGVAEASFGAEQCTIPVTSTWTWSGGTCNVSSSDAVVGGNIVINTASTSPSILTIAAGGVTFGFPNGNSITICATNCSITIGAGSQIVKTGISVGGVTYSAYVEDKDGDKYWDAQAVTSTNPYGAGGFLRASSTQLGLVGGGDCYDVSGGAGATSTHPGQSIFFTTANGGGSFDYNCDGASTQQNTNSESVCIGLAPLNVCQNQQTTGLDWDRVVPSCGQVGGWVGASGACVWVGGVTGCVAPTSSRTQACI